MEKFPYYRGELDRGQFNPNDATILELTALLKDPALESEIDQGNVTLAMIRPNVGPEANTKSLPDLECAWEIEGMINNLGILAKFSFCFGLEEVEEFYQGDPKERMLIEPPKNPKEYTQRWPEFKDFMASDPTTALLLYSPNGNAIQLWRSHLGHWNIDEVRDPSTIRGILGVNKYNNLVHGSDSPEAIKRELKIISRCLLKATDVKKYG